MKYLQLYNNEKMFYEKIPSYNIVIVQDLEASLYDKTLCIKCINITWPLLSTDNFSSDKV